MQANNILKIGVAKISVTIDTIHREMANMLSS